MGFHHLYFRTFVHATEDEEKVTKSLRYLVGDAEVNRERSEGHHGNPIMVLESTLSNIGEIREFFDRFDREELERLITTLEKRVDEHCNFFLRVDKQEALQGDLKLVNHDDIIRIRGKIECYPSKYWSALEACQKFIRERIEDK